MMSVPAAFGPAVDVFPVEFDHWVQEDAAPMMERTFYMVDAETGRTAFTFEACEFVLRKGSMKGCDPEIWDPTLRVHQSGLPYLFGADFSNWAHNKTTEIAGLAAFSRTFTIERHQDEDVTTVQISPLRATGEKLFGQVSVSRPTEVVLHRGVPFPEEIRIDDHRRWELIAYDPGDSIRLPVPDRNASPYAFYSCDECGRTDRPVIPGAAEPRVTMEEALQRAREYYDIIDEKLSEPGATIGFAAFYDRCHFPDEARLTGEPYCQYEAATWDFIVINRENPDSEPLMFQWSDQYEYDRYTGQVVIQHHEGAITFPAPLYSGVYYGGDWANVDVVDGDDLGAHVGQVLRVHELNRTVHMWRLAGAANPNLDEPVTHTLRPSLYYGWISDVHLDISWFVYDAVTADLILVELSRVELEQMWGFDVQFALNRPGWYVR